MKALRFINKFSGIISAIVFFIMVVILIQTRTYVDNIPFYYLCWVLFSFGAVFLLTALIFAVYAVIRRRKQRRMKMMVRHYLYAAVGIYAACLVAGYIANGEILWRYIIIALELALFQLYFSGYKLSVSSSKS